MSKQHSLVACFGRFMCTFVQLPICELNTEELISLAKVTRFQKTFPAERHLKKHTKDLNLAHENKSVIGKGRQFFSVWVWEYFTFLMYRHFGLFFKKIIGFNSSDLL